MIRFGQGKSAIVTGSSRGIGRAIALKLAAHGFGVTVNYASNKDEADGLVEAISAAGGAAIAVQANVASADECASLFDHTTAQFGGVDVIVNNAGVMSLKSIAETDDALFARMFDINTRGTFQMMRLAANHLRNGGRVINLSTSAIGLALPNYAVYCATKAAVESLTIIMSKEMRGRDITVNAVAPGPTATELFFEGKDEAFIERLTKLSPLERLGQPDDIASVVAFLASPEGSWINGQILRANGGTV